MIWDSEAKGWPNAEHSRFVTVRGLKWHVQEAGKGPSLVFLHGAGASTHTWRDLLPDLARDHHVVAIDLPGQGFSDLGDKDRCGLEAVSSEMSRLMDELEIRPAAIVGHSAGAALALRLALDRKVRTQGVVSINGALSNFPGLAAIMFPALAKMLSLNPLTAITFSRIAGTPHQTRRLIEATGSQIDAAGIAQYQRLLSSPRHVDATLAMMARWELDPLIERLGAVSVPVLFMAGSRDQAVPVSSSRRAARLVPQSETELFPDAGHLLHEEQPGPIADRIRRFVDLHAAG